MARFEIVTRTFSQPTTQAAAMLHVIQHKRGEAPFKAPQEMLLESLNSLSLRQRLVSHEMRAEQGKVIVDMVVENML